MSGWWLRFNIMICRHSYSDKFYTFFSPFAINCQLPCLRLDQYLTFAHKFSAAIICCELNENKICALLHSSSKLKCFRGGEDIIYTAIWSKADKGSSISLLQGPGPRFVNPENVDFFTHQRGVEAKMKMCHFTTQFDCNAFARRFQVLGDESNVWGGNR